MNKTTKNELDLQANNHYPRGVEKVPSPSKPHGQARKNSTKKRKKQARSTHVLVYPKLEEEGRPYHFPFYTSSKI
jgi:hypothetical protein